MDNSITKSHKKRSKAVEVLKEYSIILLHQTTAQPSQKRHQGASTASTASYGRRHATGASASTAPSQRQPLPRTTAFQPSQQRHQGASTASTASYGRRHATGASASSAPSQRQPLPRTTPFQPSQQRHQGASTAVAGARTSSPTTVDSLLGRHATTASTAYDSLPAVATKQANATRASQVPLAS
jgi:hypothetical protein